MAKTTVRVVPSMMPERPKATEAMKNYTDVGKKGQEVINERLDKNLKNWDEYFKNKK